MELDMRLGRRRSGAEIKDREKDPLIHRLTSYHVQMLNFDFAIRAFQHIGIVLAVHEENTSFARSIDKVLDRQTIPLQFSLQSFRHRTYVVRLKLSNTMGFEC